MPKKSNGENAQTPKSRSSTKSSDTLVAELAILNEAITSIEAVSSKLIKKRGVVEAKIAKLAAPVVEMPPKPKKTLAELRDDAQAKNRRRNGQV
jgi:hypothetical protein